MKEISFGSGNEISSQNDSVTYRQESSKEPGADNNDKKESVIKTEEEKEEELRKEEEKEEMEKEEEEELRKEEEKEEKEKEEEAELRKEEEKEEKEIRKEMENEEEKGKEEEEEKEEKEEEKDEEKEEEEEKDEEKEKEEERQQPERKSSVNKERFNNESTISNDEDEEAAIFGQDKNMNVEIKEDEDSIEMNPAGWDKDYEIRISSLMKEINDTEKNHELWQNGIKNRKEKVLERWEMIKKKHKDRLIAQRKLYVVVDSVLNKDYEATTFNKENEEEEKMNV